MKMKTILTLMSVMSAVLFAVVLAGCGSTTPAETKKSGPIRTEPSSGERPKWVDSPVSADTSELQSFTGSSGRFATSTGDQGSRAYAEINGRNQLANYYGVFIVDQARTYAGIYGITSDTLSPQVVGQSLNERMAQSLVQALAVKEYYTEVFLDQTNNRESYQSYALMQIRKDLVSRVIDQWGKEQEADLLKRAAQAQDAANRNQLEQAARFFGGNLSSKIGF